MSGTNLVTGVADGTNPSSSDSGKDAPTEITGSAGGTSTSEDAPGETYPLYYRANDGTTLSNDVVSGAEAEIFRDEEGIEFTLTTTELQQHAYTVWVVVYNFPDFCIDQDDERNFECGEGDFLNLAAGFSVMRGAGEVVDVEPTDFFTFEGPRDRFDFDDVLVGPGLVDPQGAEIHLIVRDHGPCSGEDDCHERTSTIDGGCSNPHFFGLRGEPGDYSCSDPQATGY